LGWRDVGRDRVGVPQEYPDLKTAQSMRAGRPRQIQWRGAAVSPKSIEMGS